MIDDETCTMEISLSNDEWVILALQAHDLEITLNEYLVNILKHSVANAGMKLTPNEWLDYSEELNGYTILDPDGWDRTNFEEDWAKEITKNEMMEKVSRSTVMIQH